MPFHVVKGRTGVSLVEHHARDDGLHPGLGSAAMAAIVVAALLAGGAGGVVLSPDVSPSPAPTEDWSSVIEFEVNRQLEEHLLHDHTHAPEVTPSTPPAASPSATSASTAPATPSTRRSTSPTASPRPTARPTATPTARPAPTASPQPSPTCFRPGKPQGGHDPCSWPPDG